MNVTIQMNSKQALPYIKFLFLLISGIFFAQNTLSGTVSDADEFPIKNAVVSTDSETTETNSLGKFTISYTTSEDKITFSKEGFADFSTTISSLQNNTIEIILVSNEGALPEVILRGNITSDLGSTLISGEKSVVLPSISGGVEDLLKSLPYVNSNSELSSQYMVRGGNFDENLVYINGIEIYKPQFARSGQQEGLSIINPQMTQMINFTAGGFEPSYGDKMSSVLDIYYKKPTHNSLDVEASLLGGAVTVGLADKPKKFSALVGARYRNTNFILNTLDGDTDFNPTYFDVQSSLNYEFNPKFSVSFLGSYAKNSFEMKPKSRETTFGTLFQPITLTVLYNGFENDQFVTKNASLNFNYKPIKKLNINLSPFVYHSTEEEYFDIAAGYLLEEVDPATGDPVAGFDAGGQINHARNDLDILVSGVQLRTDFKWTNNRTISFGAKFQREDIRDFQTEWQLIDSVGYSIPTQNYDIGNLDNSNLDLDYYISSRVNLQSNRISGFVQLTDKYDLGNAKMLINGGIRATYWDFNEELNISPRFQVALKPKWNREVTFRLQTGLYYQPPFYKEIRDLEGNLNPNIKSQKSLHIILGNDYELKLWNRPFVLTTEAYYKKMDDMIPYYVDNVRIRYTGENNSKGKLYGIDSRLNGEFVPGVESWFSLSYARAYQNIDDRGDIPLPTDSRFKASLFFQDEMPFNKSMKAAISLIYASGLPNGAPFFTDVYEYQSTLPAYKRVDLSLTKVFFDQGEYKAKKSGLFSKFKELSLSLDVFNVFNITNTVSNQWIRDINSGTSYAVPNRLTGRFFNVKLKASF